jgi:hypothetical protein
MTSRKRTAEFVGINIPHNKTPIPKRSKLTNDYVWDTLQQQKIMLSDYNDDWKKAKNDRFLEDITVDELEQLEEALDAPSGFDFLTLWKDVDQYLKMEDDCVMLLVYMSDNNVSGSYPNRYRSGANRSGANAKCLLLCDPKKYHLRPYNNIQEEIIWAKDTKIDTVSAIAYNKMQQIPIYQSNKYLNKYHIIDDTHRIDLKWFVLPLRVVKEYLLKHCCRVYTAKIDEEEEHGGKFSVVLCKHRDERVSHIYTGKNLIIPFPIAQEKSNAIKYLMDKYGISPQCANCVLYDICEKADSVDMFNWNGSGCFFNGQKWQAEHNYIVQYMWLNGLLATKDVFDSLKNKFFLQDKDKEKKLKKNYWIPIL